MDIENKNNNNNIPCGNEQKVKINNKIRRKKVVILYSVICVINKTHKNVF